MSLLVRPGETQPLEIGAGEKARVYHLFIPTVHGRNRFRRMITEAGGRFHGTIPLLNGLAAGIEKVFTGEIEIRNMLISQVNAQKERLIAFWQDAGNGKYDILAQPDPPDELRKEFASRQIEIARAGVDLAKTQAIIMDAVPSYGAMCADDAAYPAVRGTVAAQLLLADWDGANFDGKPLRSNGLLSDDALAQIPEGDLVVIGARAETMMQLDKTQKKASVSPAPAASGGETASI